MSLEELLKDSGGSSLWRTQRKKLIRAVIGIFVVAVAAIAGAVSLVSLHKGKTAKSAVATAESDKDAKYLAQLMRIKKEADGLNENVHAARRPAAAAFYGRRGLAGERSGSAADRIVNYDPGEGFSALSADKRELYIPTGAVFQAQLITPIKTSLDKTFVMAETTNEFRMDMKRKIPRGSRLIGRSRLNPVLKGVIVEFDTLVLPDGTETQLSGLGLSRNALPEIDGLFFSDKLVTYGTALAFGFLSGFADGAVARDTTVLGAVPQVSLSNQVLTGLSISSFQVANQMLEDIRANAIEYVIVPAGERIFVALTRRYDIVQNRGGTK